MKKLILIAICGIFMASCYNTRMVVGDVRRNEPMIEVCREWNHHLIYGLVPLDNTTMVTEEYIGDHQTYMIKTYTSFLNGLVSGLTWGIYTPTQTVFYLPIKDFKSDTKVVPPVKNDLELMIE